MPSKSPIDAERLEVANLLQSAMDEGKSFDEIAVFVEAGATFESDVVDVKLSSKDTLKAYWIWHKRFATACPNLKSKVKATHVNHKKREITLVGNCSGTHTETGGPVDPTGKKFKSSFVHVFKFNEEAEIVGLTKIWNDASVFIQLGWPIQSE